MNAILLLLASFQLSQGQESLICNNFDDEVKLAEALFLLVPQFTRGPLNDTISDNQRLNWFTDTKIPISALFSKGIFTIQMKKPSQFNTIALYERPSLIRDLGCGLSATFGLDSLSTGLCNCRNSGIKELDNSTGEYWCVIYPCSSKDAAMGFCKIDINPFTKTCIRSATYLPEDVNYKLEVPFINIRFSSIGGALALLLPHSIDVPLFAYRLLVSSLLVILSGFRRFRAFIFAAIFSHCASAAFQHIISYQ
jgi:hypothetical protein